MSTWLATQAQAAGRAALQRLRPALWPITQTSVAAGLAWYLTHDPLGHPQPFFAPIAAVVCLSATNVLRGQRAVQMIIRVTLGIGLGAAVQALLGTGRIAISVAVFIALCIAVLIGRGFIAQGLMFVNQTAISAVLVLVSARSGMVSERLFDTLIGGGIAIVVGTLLFPVDPLILLRGARGGMLPASVARRHAPSRGSPRAPHARRDQRTSRRRNRRRHRPRRSGRPRPRTAMLATCRQPRTTQLK